MVSFAHASVLANGPIVTPNGNGKHGRNFDGILLAELAAEFGKEKGKLAYERLRGMDILLLSSSISGEPLTYERLPFLGRGCLVRAFEAVFSRTDDGPRAMAAFERASEKYSNGLGKMAACNHECELAFDADDGKKKCVALLLMAGAQAKCGKDGRNAPPANARAASMN